MFSGAQISLYPMTDDFVGVILGALGALDPWRDRLRIETDDISTLLVGPPEVLFPAMRDLFVAAAGSGKHCVLSAAISRGCPGEPDDPICRTDALGGPVGPLEPRKDAAIAAVRQADVTGQGIGSECGSLDFSFWMLSGEPAEQSHARSQWIVANLQAYHAI